MMLADVMIDEAKLADFCRQNGISRLSIFGSALRTDFRKDSDLDLLVEFKVGNRVSLFDVGGMAMDLTELLGREVDLRTPQDLSPYFRDEVVRSARLIYAE